jgi:hypothetical protein
MDIYNKMLGLITIMNQPYFIVDKMSKVLQPRSVFCCTYLNVGVNTYQSTSRETGKSPPLPECINVGIKNP